MIPAREEAVSDNLPSVSKIGKSFAIFSASFLTSACFSFNWTASSRLSPDGLAFFALSNSRTRSAMDWAKRRYLLTNSSTPVLMRSISRYCSSLMTCTVTGSETVMFSR